MRSVWSNPDRYGTDGWMSAVGRRRWDLMAEELDEGNGGGGEGKSARDRHVFVFEFWGKIASR